MLKREPGGVPGGPPDPWVDEDQSAHPRSRWPPERVELDGRLAGLASNVDELVLEVRVGEQPSHLGRGVEPSPAGFVEEAGAAGVLVGDLAHPVAEPSRWSFNSSSGTSNKGMGDAGAHDPVDFSRVRSERPVERHGFGEVRQGEEPLLDEAEPDVADQVGGDVADLPVDEGEFGECVRLIPGVLGYLFETTVEEFACHRFCLARLVTNDPPDCVVGFRLASDVSPIGLSALFREWALAGSCPWLVAPTLDAPAECAF